MGEEMKIKNTHSKDTFSFWRKFSEYNKNVSWLLFIFICIFTMGTIYFVFNAYKSVYQLNRANQLNFNDYVPIFLRERK